VEYFLDNRSWVYVHSKTVVPQNGKEVHSGGIVGDDYRNYGDKLLTITTLHQSCNSVCVLKGPKLSSNIGFIFAKKLCKLLYNVFLHKCTI